MHPQWPVKYHLLWNKTALEKDHTSNSVHFGTQTRGDNRQSSWLVRNDKKLLSTGILDRPWRRSAILSKRLWRIRANCFISSGKSPIRLKTIASVTTLNYRGCPSARHSERTPNIDTQELTIK